TCVLVFFICITLYYSYLSFFSRYTDDRDLHSFPTRRSSDLLSAGYAGSDRRQGRGSHHQPARPHGRSAGTGADAESLTAVCRAAEQPVAPPAYCRGCTRCARIAALSAGVTSPGCQQTAPEAVS